MSSFDKVVKDACKPKRTVPNSKYLDTLIAATYSEDGSVHDVCKALAPRFREPNVTVVFKALVTLHTIIRNGATDNILAYLSNGDILTNVAAPNWEENLASYATYLDTRIRAFRDLQHDAIHVQSESNRDMRNSARWEGALPQDRRKTIMGRKLRIMTVEKGLLREIEVVQKTVDALCECRFYLDNLDDQLNIMALRMVVKDLLILFQACNEGIINMLEHYFEMSKVDATEALKLYRHFCKQTERVVEFLGVAKKLQNLLNVPIPNLKHAPVSLVGSLEEYLNDPHFEQNRIEYKANKETSERVARNGGKSRGVTKKLAEPTPKESTPSASQPSASSEPPKPADGTKSMQDFFAAIEEEQAKIFNPRTGSPSTAFHQQATLDPFSQGGALGTSPFQQPSSVQPQQTGFIMPRQTGFPVQSGHNPFGQHPQPQLTAMPFIQPQPTAASLMPQMTATNPFRQNNLSGMDGVQPQATGSNPSPANLSPFGPSPVQGNQVMSPFQNFGRTSGQQQMPFDTTGPFSTNQRPDMSSLFNTKNTTWMISTSWILQRLYSLDTSSPDFLHHLHYLIERDEGEQYLTSLQGSELARLVDFLDKALGTIPVTEDVAQECLHKLQEICGHHTILPSSYIVSGQIARVGDGPVISSVIADVWEGTYRSRKVSIKYLRIRTEDRLTLKKSFFKEAVIWKRLGHPNIVPFIGVTTDPLQIISEWTPNGSLTEFVERNPSASRIGLLSDVSEGLDYLHANNIIHGNLNGSSILVDHDGHARLTDFELASTVRGTNSVTQENRHTAEWIAPEILEGTDTITREADVFAFGMVVMEIFTGARPQEAQELGLTDSMWDMTVRCWHQDPALRPTMAEMVGLLRKLLASLSIEADLSDFLQACKTWDKGDQGKKAQEFADRLDKILDDADFQQQKRKYLRHLQKLCSAFCVLPSSFTLPPAFVKCNADHFASGGYSKVYKATFRNRPVVIKTLNFSTQMERGKLHRLLVKEVIGWKWLQHENILPFVGVMFAPTISIVSERMENGNIVEFIKVNRDYNRLRLLVGAVTGLEYLHEHNIVHGDLKGVNILIDSECRARLADFGLAAIIDETTSMTTAADGKSRGTTRWMAPELLFPDMFGFTGKFAKQLPSKDTDIYAIGMTIIEVLTGCVPFAGVARNETVIFKVMGGTRPERPPSGLSDTLWELLVATWAVQHAQEPQGRPPACTVLERLKECVDHWGESIVPIIPESWEDNDSDDGVTIRGITTASDFCDRIDHPVVDE